MEYICGAALCPNRPGHGGNLDSTFPPAADSKRAPLSLLGLLAWHTQSINVD